MRSFGLSLTLSLGFLALSVNAIRRRYLRDQAAILWLAVSIVMVLLSITLPLHLLDHFSRLVGVAVPSNLILLLAVLFLIVLVFHLSISVARLAEKNTKLAQEIGILKAHEPADSLTSGAPSATVDGARPVGLRETSLRSTDDAARRIAEPVVGSPFSH